MNIAWRALGTLTAIGAVVRGHELGGWLESFLLIFAFTILINNERVDKNG